MKQPRRTKTIQICWKSSLFSALHTLAVVKRRKRTGVCSSDAGRILSRFLAAMPRVQTMRRQNNQSMVVAAVLQATAATSMTTTTAKT
jgi:hypothetical protein